MAEIQLKNQQGFTLIELMIVVAIIGILTSLALPSFRTFQGKARQAESRTNLNQIYVLQESYFVDANMYVDFANYSDVYGYSATDTYDCDATTAERQDLGFRLSGCTGSAHAGAPRYGYVAVATIASGNLEFVAFARSGGDNGNSAVNLIMPGCGSFDETATIDHTKTFTRTSDSVKSCDESLY